MPNILNLQTRLIKRIENSGLNVTVHYPPVRDVAAGSSPGAAPVNPLTGDTTPAGVFPTDPVGYLPTVTLKCLWMDALTGREATDVAHTELRKVHAAGWVVGATSMARVLVSEAALDAANPYAGTVFDGASHVEHLGARFKVLQITPITAGFAMPVSYHVWLVGERINQG